MEAVLRAAQENDVVRLRSLLDAKPELANAADGYWSRGSPLHKACEAGSLEAVQLLVERGARLNCKDPWNFTPFTRACWAGRAEVVSFLLSQEPDAAWWSEDLSAGLMKAICARALYGSDHPAVIRLLIEDGRTPIKSLTGPESPLYQACRYGHVERARVLLLEAGADHSVLLREESASLPVESLQLLLWYDCELKRPLLLSKARAVEDGVESIAKAPEKVGAKTKTAAKQARREAAPAYLKGRVEKGEALPALKMVGQPRKRPAGTVEEERQAVCEFVVRWMKEDLFVELMEGLRLSKVMPGQY